MHSNIPVPCGRALHLIYHSGQICPTGTGAQVQVGSAWPITRVKSTVGLKSNFLSTFRRKQYGRVRYTTKCFLQYEVHVTKGETTLVTC